MGLIRLLPHQVQNKIAAGEVIERPASAVKELVENALDAGATAIEVRLEEGGRRLVRVADDGCGMDLDDLRQSILRHATSKISEAEDIQRVRTLGFRGEALPSIASVSRLRMASAVPGAPGGHELLVEGGALRWVRPAPALRGTVVEARDLFYCTPARAAFMVAPAAETAAAVSVVCRIALARPGTAFRLFSGGQPLLEAPAESDLRRRVAALYGQGLPDELVPLDAHSGDQTVRVSGWMALPSAAHPATCGKTGKDVHFIVNGRWIKHPGVPRVAAQACQGRLPPRHFPFTVILVDTDPARVDINVHPAKTEARFADSGKVMGTVHQAVQKAASVGHASLAGFAESRADGGMHDGQAAPPGAAGVVSAMGRRQPPESGVPMSAASRSAEEGHPDSLLAPAGHRAIGQAGGRYLVVECPEGLLLADPHALHERCNYERLRGRWHPPESQPLLVPETLQVTPEEAAMLAASLPLLRQIGLEAQAAGPGRFLLTAAPGMAHPGRWEPWIRDFLADAGEGAPSAGSIQERLGERAVASIACRTAVRMGRPLAEGEVCALLDMLRSAGQDPTCPHGRPAVIRLSWGELDRRFGRG